MSCYGFRSFGFPLDHVSWEDECRLPLFFSLSPVLLFFCEGVKSLVGGRTEPVVFSWVLCLTFSHTPFLSEHQDFRAFLPSFQSHGLFVRFLGLLSLDFVQVLLPPGEKVIFPSSYLVRRMFPPLAWPSPFPFLFSWETWLSFDLLTRLPLAFSAGLFFDLIGVHYYSSPPPPVLL